MQSGSEDSLARNPERHPDLAPSSVSPSSSSAAPVPAKRRRNNAGVPTESCLTCRARKVKCAGRSTTGPCTNCTRLDLGCSFNHASSDLTQSGGKVSRTLPSRSLTEAGTARKRAQRACHQCHVHKTKCSGDLPACKRCAGAGLACEYMPAKRKFATVPHSTVAQQSVRSEKEAAADDASEGSPSASEVPHSNAAVPSTERASSVDESDVEQLITEKSVLNNQIILEHLQVWFELLHPVQCFAFFHPRTTFKEADERRFTSIIAAGVCSITGLFISPDDDGRRFTERCNHWVKFHLSRTAGIFTKERLTLLVLSSIYDLVVGDWPKVWEYSATASRIITAMQYNWDTTAGSFIEQESLRRLVWQVYIIDRILAGGYSEHLTLREENLFLSLPCDDYSFRNNQLVMPPERLSQRPLPASHKQGGNISLLSINLRLMSIRHQLLGITKRYAMAPTDHPRAPHTEPSSVMGDIQKLQAKLNAVKEALPDNAQVSETNIKRFYGTPEWSTYFMVHTWMFQLHLDLYRFSLPGIREQATGDLLQVLPPDFLAKCHFQAIAFAITLARFWESCRRVMAQHPQGRYAIITADFTIGICVIQCTKVLLITRQYKMFFDLQANSTVPPFRNEVVDDAVLAGLINSNIELLDHLQILMPKIRDMSRDVREAVANFQFTSEIDNPSMIGMPFVQPPENVRLPGPHYVLENLHAMQTVDDEANRQRSASLADQYLRKRSAGSSRGSQLSASPPVLSHKQIPYGIGPPDVPFYLAQIRARNTVPMTTAASNTSANAEPQHQHQPLDPLVANYEFDMTGVLAHIPNYPLVSPETHMSMPAAPFDMSGSLQAQHMPHDVMSAHQQYILASQPQLGMYVSNYEDLAPQETSGGQVFNVPYREFG
ncbi:hypothetical protein CONLIGDRAFT_204728 [Coniochaeta ligniaria NRRL 30616]|uniref:Zn(2)-C6 fungal-type domain-containing protein n=1 Tax=Coniochaeta ligniaria NRRL 30616 TaxID=1408157 RepID=A0A1J7J3R4_9PEZI|nr:hypothetical protein CONLIGDRAFT_204728 [Coniochaeta ligniaria NRRL 30616]